MIRILIVEDDRDLNLAMGTFLRRRGYEVSAAHCVPEAWDELAEHRHDLIISDIMMDKVDGFEFARMIRQEDRDIPIIFISARDDIQAQIRGFTEGVDDYMVKPVDFEELDLRINALLRRAGIRQTHKIELSDFVMDEEERAAYLDGKEVKLTSREFDILFKLLSYPRKTFTRAMLMSEFWDLESEATPRTVDVYITRIREKVQAAESFEIVTVHGLGYKGVIR